ncbi:hypothetical protein [Actinomadura fibrosa]|uniref:Peptidase C14 caspase domain-containing protein n=1 Tax=Actinomadura fibrosa TaxID=111802 RepID=A0ABW2XDD4_9ACTN|nr:hypothetical protein [Actinomadura fibrosa]
MPRRLALCVVVGEFTGGGWTAIARAVERGRLLRRALEDFGYACTVLSGADATARAMGEAFYEHVERLESDDLLVVAVLSHGLVAETGELYAVGADGRHDRATRISDWIKEVEDFGPQGRPRVLFLLDLCQAGLVARRPPPPAAPGASRRSWVLAACPPGRAAFDGRFTEAAANVLHAIGRRERDVHGGSRYVRLTVFAKRVKQELDRLVASSDAYPQDAIGGLVDLAEAEDVPPFFANPAHDADPAKEVRENVEGPVGAFVDVLDQVADPRHYTLRASGRIWEDDEASGCFTGRRREMGALSRWLDGGARGSLRIVTGSPGSGKSAVLGLLVCAAHPKLRRQTQRLWFPVGHVPAENAALAVAHARQRGTAEILGSLAGQLGLGDVPDWPSLMEALHGRPRPALVIDAVDEALQPEALADELRALALARDAGGRPLCRMLVATRPGPAFEMLRAAAGADDAVIDLDDRSREEIRRDVEDYVRLLLRLASPYDTSAYAPAAAAFATAVAERLSAITGRPGAAGRWGEFLVASLYTHRLVTRQPPVLDPAEAAAFGRQVPGTMPDVLDLILDASSPLRRVLSMLAHARGEGMPLEVARTLIPLFGGCDDVRALLAEARFYLRQSADTDGTTLYRLFHQGLADHLRDPAKEGGILDLLLPGTWDGAVPYARRHAIQHAVAADRADELLRHPGFLAAADPVTLEPALPAAASAEARLAAAVYRTSIRRHRTLAADERRQVLAVDAARYGSTALAEDLGAGRAWRPLRASGSQVAAALRQTIQVAAGPVTALACAVSAAGRPVAVVAPADGPPGVFDLATGAFTGVRLGDDAATALACATVASRTVVVSGHPRGAVNVWDLAGGARIGGTLHGHTYEITDLVCAGPPDAAVAVAAADNGTVRAWDLTTLAPVGTPPASEPPPAAGRPPAGEPPGGSVACVEIDGRLRAFAPAGDGTITCWDLLTGTVIARHTVSAEPGEILLTTVDDLVIACGPDGVVRLDPAATGTAVPPHRAGPAEEAADRLPRALTGVRTGAPVAVVGYDDGLVHVTGLPPDSGTTVRFTHGTQVTAAACAVIAQKPVAITAGADGCLRTWDLASVTPLGSPHRGHLSPIASLACADVSGRTVVLSSDHEGRTLVWPPDTARPSEIPAGGPLAVLPGGRPTALTAGDHGVQEWDLTTLRPLPALPGLDGAGPFTSLATLRLGRRDILITGSGDGAMAVWDAATGERLSTLRGDDQAPVADLAPCPGTGDRGIVVSLSATGAVRIWDLATMDAGGHPIDHCDEAGAVACARVGRRPVLVAGMLDGRLRTWDVPTGRETGPPLAGGGVPVTAVACARLGTRTLAAVATRDATMRVWDLDERTMLQKIALPETAQRLLLTPAGHIVAAMHWDIVTFSSGPAASTVPSRPAAPPRSEQ